MKEEILKEIGLNESERRVYITLLELGDSTRGKIVEKSKITGSKIYEVLEKLQKKGLVSKYIKNKVKHFRPMNPKQLLNYLEEKKEKIINLEKQTQLIIPILLSKFNSSTKEQEVELITGIKGLEIVFKEQIEILKNNDICYVLGGTGAEIKDSTKDFFEKIHLMRENKKIKTKMLFNTNQKKDTEKRYSSKKYAHTKIKYIEHSSPVAINIYKNKPVIIIFGED
nr:hypothetical protein [Nanoarchaeota archaeon]